jgi:hypothetical protein
MHSRLPYVRTVITDQVLYILTVGIHESLYGCFSFEELLVYPNIKCLKLQGMECNIPLYRGRYTED